MLLALAAASGPGCRDEEARRAKVAEEVEILSRDQCLAAAITDVQRGRLVRAAKAGRIDAEDVERYIDEIRARAEHAQKSGMEIHRFCRIQLEVWRRHFGH